MTEKEKEKLLDAIYDLRETLIVDVAFYEADSERLHAIQTQVYKLLSLLQKDDK